MSTLLEFIVFLLVWIAGCVVFDGWLGLSGGWLMSSGVLTFILAGWVAGFVSIHT